MKKLHWYFEVRHMGVLLIRFTLSEWVGAPEQKWANNHAADNFLFFEMSTAFKFCFSSPSFGFIG